MNYLLHHLPMYVQFLHQHQTLDQNSSLFDDRNYDDVPLLTDAGHGVHFLVDGHAVNLDFFVPQRLRDNMLTLFDRCTDPDDGALDHMFVDARTFLDHGNPALCFVTHWESPKKQVN